jgi:hypothetical protein
MKIVIEDGSVYFVGNGTFEAKEDLKVLGCRWDVSLKQWYLTAGNWIEAGQPDYNWLAHEVSGADFQALCLWSKEQTEHRLPFGFKARMAQSLIDKHPILAVSFDWGDSVEWRDFKGLIKDSGAIWIKPDWILGLGCVPDLLNNLKNYPEICEEIKRVVPAEYSAEPAKTVRIESELPAAAAAVPVEVPEVKIKIKTGSDNSVLKIFASFPKTAEGGTQPIDAKIYRSQGSRTFGAALSTSRSFKKCFWKRWKHFRKYRWKSKGARTIF